MQENLCNYTVKVGNKTMRRFNFISGSLSIIFSGFGITDTKNKHRKRHLLNIFVALFCVHPKKFSSAVYRPEILPLPVRELSLLE